MRWKARSASLSYTKPTYQMCHHFARFLEYQCQQCGRWRGLASIFRALTEVLEANATVDNGFEAGYKTICRACRVEVWLSDDLLFVFQS